MYRYRSVALHVYNYIIVIIIIMYNSVHALWQGNAAYVIGMTSSV